MAIEIQLLAGQTAKPAAISIVSSNLTTMKISKPVKIEFNSAYLNSAVCLDLKPLALVELAKLIGLKLRSIFVLNSFLRWYQAELISGLVGAIIWTPASQLASYVIELQQNQEY